MIATLPRTLLALGTAVAALGLAPLAVAQSGSLAEEMAQASPTPGAAADATNADGPTDPTAPERARLNQEQANAACAQLEENAASKRAYDDAVREREDLIQRQAAEAARAEAAHQAAMARWEETVKACKRGDRKRCEAGQP